MTASPSFPAEKSAVLLVAESLRAGGLTSYARMLRRGLAGAGLAPRLVAPEGPPPGLLPGPAEQEVAIFPGLTGGMLKPFAFRRLVRWARHEGFALVHGLSAFTAAGCERLAGALDVPFVLSVHHYQSRGDLRLGRRCRGILACSESIRENLVNDARVPKELVQVVPLGIEIPDLDVTRPRPAERLPVVALFAPLTPHQDAATFVRAARIVSDARAGVQFLVVGEGPEEPALRKLTRQLKLEKQVTFSHENVPHDQLLPDVDVYAQTPRREGFGFAVLEAMAWGRPVVATAAGGLISLVRDGQTGFLVPVGQPEAAAAKILDLLGSAELRANMGLAGRAQALKEFSLPRMIERTVLLYASVLGLKERAASASS
jgi:glycosyltransferase involved in cell wall biosynthesis